MLNASSPVSKWQMAGQMAASTQASLGALTGSLCHGRLHDVSLLEFQSHCSYPVATMVVCVKQSKHCEKFPKHKKENVIDNINRMTKKIQLSETLTCPKNSQQPRKRGELP
jgi:phosphoribosyl-dephospho-CoA transferase